MGGHPTWLVSFLVETASRLRRWLPKRSAAKTPSSPLNVRPSTTGRNWPNWPRPAARPPDGSGAFSIGSCGGVRGRAVPLVARVVNDLIDPVGRYRRSVIRSVVFAIGLAMLGSTYASAECDGPAVSFAERAGEAPLVVIGDVISIDPAASVSDELGRSSRFTIEVLHVLRGEAVTSIVVDDEPTGPCSGYVLARRGDRLALAVGLTNRLHFDFSWSAVAWIRGLPLDYEGIERTTVAGAFRALGLQAPDTATVATSDSMLPMIHALIALIALVAASTAAATVWGRPAGRSLDG